MKVDEGRFHTQENSSTICLLASSGKIQIPDRKLGEVMMTMTIISETSCSSFFFFFFVAITNYIAFYIVFKHQP